MSYKHNDLMAMRQSYWNNQECREILQEKQFLQQLLSQQQVFTAATLADAEYFFFVLPSLIIVKGHALGFQHPRVVEMMTAYIQQNKPILMQKQPIKIQFKF